MDNIYKFDDVIINETNEKAKILHINEDGTFILTKGYNLEIIWCSRDKFTKIEPKEVIRTNKVQHNTTTIEWNINGNNLNVKVEGYQINIKTYLKILIQEIEQLKNFKYTRVSPYRIGHEYARNREDKNHLFTIQFIDVKDDNKIKTKEIIRTNKCMAIEAGVYDYFIPDLLEVAIDRNLMTLEEDVYKYREQAFANPVDITYIDNRFSRENLKKQGWRVPSGYKE